MNLPNEIDKLKQMVVEARESSDYWRMSWSEHVRAQDSLMEALRYGANNGCDVNDAGFTDLLAQGEYKPPPMPKSMISIYEQDA